MNLINLIMQTAKTDTYPKGEASELVTHLWSTANKEQHILIDNLFVKLIGKPLSELIKRVAPDQYEQTIKHLALEEKEKVSTIQISWHIEDIKSVRHDLDEQQCAEVLGELKHNHDASIGINWDVIECVSDYLYPLKESIKI